MTERLREVVTRLEQLSEEDQDAYALAIQAELDEDRRWDEAMKEPNDLALDRLIAEAKDQVARGEARDIDELL
jgi:hypothetical protein